MRIPATAAEVRTLVQLAKLDEQAQSLDPRLYHSRREAARKHASTALLERYETLREHGRAPAVAAIERGACSGCHIRLPTMVDHQARHSPTVHVCPRCGRLLYAPELLAETGAAVAAADRKTVPGRGGSAAKEP